MRVKNRVCLALSCLLSAAMPAVAGEPYDFEDRVRAFLLSNPEVIVEALDVLMQREAQQAVVQTLSNYPELFTDAPSLGLGPEDAPIRVVEFFDYKCVPCKAMHDPLISLVKKNPNIRIEMRHLPILSPGSERAARFALAVSAVAGKKAYADVHDDLWAIRGPLNIAAFERIAADHDLDFQAIADMMDSAEISQRISLNRDVAIALEILGTPAFITPKTVNVGQSDVDELAKVWLSQ